MPNIVVYGTPMGSSFRPHWALHEAGLAYETKSVDLRNKTAEFMALNPAGKIPVMTYDDVVLSESAAIVQFIAEKHKPELLGEQTPEARAQSLRWQLFTLLDLNPHFTTLALKNWGMPQGEEAEKKANDALARYLPVFEGWLKGHEYVIGDSFTVADIVCRATFMYAEFVQYDLSAYPNVTAWMGRCAARPAYAAAQGK